jgi:hypothetical protein
LDEAIQARASEETARAESEAQAARVTDEFRAAQGVGAQRLLTNAVQWRTLERYLGDWKKWDGFMHRWLTAPSEDGLFMVGIPLRAQIMTIAAFLFYGWSTLGLKATTVISTLSGVRHNFRANCLAMEVFEHPSVRACKTALNLEERKRDGFTAVQRKHPLTVDMLYALIRHALAPGCTVDTMVGVGVLLAFTCLLRTSEYVPNQRSERQNSCHALLAADVLFEVVRNGQRSMVESFLVTADMWRHVTLVKFILRSAKNDKLRVGSTFWLRNEPSESGLNVVQAVFEWSLRSNFAPTDYLMFLPRHSRVPLGVADLCAREQTHQGVCGALRPEPCTLRAGGASDSTIQMMGRWKSMDSCLTYQESSVREYDEVQRILRDPSVYTAEDVRLIHDKGVSVRGRSNK